MAKTKSKKKFSDEEILKEIKALSDKAKRTSSTQMDLLLTREMGDEDIDTGFDISKLKDTADPDTSHRLYYGMRRLMIDYLPAGKKNKKLRQFIYNEKNLFLNRGQEINLDGKRGSDGRMAYISNFLVISFNVVIDWIRSGAHPFDLYTSFRQLNIERGYYKDAKSPENNFDSNLKALLKVPSPKKDNKNE